MTEDKNIKASTEKYYVKSKPSTRLYALKIAFFNTFMFCLIAFTDTATHHIHQTHDISKFHFSYWLYIVAIIIFIGNYFLQLNLKPLLLSIIGPFVFTVMVSFVVSLIKFGPFPQNLYQMLAFALFPCPSVIASFVRYPPVRSDFIKDSNIEIQAKVEWLKEYSNLMRTVGIYGGIAFFAFLLSWLNYMWLMANIVFADNIQERFFVHGLYSIQGTGIALYVLLGPLYECFQKAQNTRNMLLDIKKQIL